MNHRSKLPFRLVVPVAALALSAVASRPVLADVFDGARQAFQTDIPNFFTKKVPHFFQDDVPCAFGGQPTSGAKKSCESKSDSDKDGAASPPPAKPEPAQPH